jgi:hypothetical protein
MGVDLQGLKSYRNMRDALRYCVRQAQRARASKPAAGKAQPEKNQP